MGALGHLGDLLGLRPLRREHDQEAMSLLGQFVVLLDQVLLLAERGERPGMLELAFALLQHFLAGVAHDMLGREAGFGQRPRGGLQVLGRRERHHHVPDRLEHAEGLRHVALVHRLLIALHNPRHQ